MYKRILWLVLFPFRPLLTMKAKRLILLSSLYGKLTKRKSIDNETLTKLNRALHLVSSDCNKEAILLPIRIQNLIWDNEEIDLTQYEEKDKQEMIREIIKSIPDYLRYNKDGEDIARLLSLLPAL